MNTTFPLVAALFASLAATAGPCRAEGAANAIFVPRVAIYPGDTISADALVSVQSYVGAPGSAVFGSRADELVGKVARRTLLAGRPIPASAVREPSAVIQGKACDIVFKSGALTISGTAVPMKSAAVGEIVAARNSETGITVQAVVQPGGTLLVKSR